MALPDVDRNSWQRDQADLFRQLTNAKIGAAQFQQTTGQQIADATQRIAALATASPVASVPSSLEGPSTRGSQASPQSVDSSDALGSAPNLPNAGPTAASSTDFASSPQNAPQGSVARPGAIASFGDFASGLIDQARQRVAALSGGTPADTSGGPTPGPLTMPRPEGTITPPDVVGNAGQALAGQYSQAADTFGQTADQINTQSRGDVGRAVSQANQQFASDVADPNVVTEPKAPGYGDSDNQRKLLAQAGSAVMNVTPSGVAAATPLIHTPAWLNEILAPARNAPQDVQNALRTFANARLAGQVDAETLGMRAQRILGSADTSQAASSFERTGQFTANPTPEQQGFGSEVQRFMQDTGQQGRANGYIAGDVTTGAPGAPAHYFPHIYQDNLNAARIAAGKGGLNPRDFYSNSRVYPTLQDAIAAGKQPLDSVSEPLRHYAARIGDSEAKVALVSDLRNASPTAVMDLAPGQAPPAGWRSGLSVAPQFNGVAFPDQVGKALDNILNPSRVQRYGLGRAIQGGLSEAKSTLFSLSGFHLLTELRQAYRANGINGVPVLAKSLWNSAVPGAYDAFRLRNADAFSDAARAGVTGLAGAGRAIPDIEPGLAGRLARPLVRSLSSGLATGGSAYTVSQQAGDDDQTALRNGLIAGGIGAILGPTAGPAINRQLWTRLVPSLKMLTFQVQRAAGHDPQAAAAFVNNTFGGQNLAAIARSPTVQDIARTAILAPDWWESWARQMGTAFQGGSAGAMSRAYWARTTALDLGLGLEGLNYALNGHLTTGNDPEHRFDLELTGLYDKMGWAHTDAKTGMPARVYADVLGPVRSILQTGRDPGQFIKGRLGLVPRAGVEAISNQNYAGRPIVPPFSTLPEAVGKQAGNLASQVAPVGAQSLEQASKAPAPPVVSGISAVTGMRVSQGARTSEVTPRLAGDVMGKLRQEGIPWQPGPVGGEIDGVPLTRAERTQYQTVANQYREQNIRDTLADPGWRGASSFERSNAIQDAVRQADDQAASDIANTISQDEADRRLGNLRKATSR